MTQSARPKLASTANPGSHDSEASATSVDASPSEVGDEDQSHLERIVALHLLGASERLSAQGMAAYVSGWCSALDAVDEWIQFAPQLGPAERALFADLMRALREAQDGALDEDR